MRDQMAGIELDLDLAAGLTHLDAAADPVNRNRVAIGVHGDVAFHVHHAFVQTIDLGDPGRQRAQMLLLHREQLPRHGAVNGIHNLVIPTGTTILGDRRGTNPGPLLLGLYNEDDPQPGTRLMQIEGDYVRITGLRLQGPSGSEDTWYDTIGILIGDPIHSLCQPVQTIIDRNELFNWPTVAIGPSGASSDQDCLDGQPGTLNPDTNVFKPGPIGSVFATLIAHNFIHDNQEHGLGYGIAVGHGAGASVLGNVFSFNRHAVTADDNTGNQYLALDNLVLSQRPVYCGSIICKSEQDFDVHGTLSLGGQHDGGFAGYNAEIAWSTLIDGGNLNFALRGRPCISPDLFFNNNSGADVSDAFQVFDFFGVEDHPTSSTENLSIFGNTWNALDSTTFLGVGGFDGERVNSSDGQRRALL